MIPDLTWKIVLLHLALYPLYQLLGTLRHELAHAVAAILSGFRVEELRVLPCRIKGEFYFGYTRWNYRLPARLEDLPKPNRHMYLAPYYVNLALLLVGLWTIPAVEWKNPHRFAVAFMLLVVSPFADTLYSAVKFALFGEGDLFEASRIVR